MAENQPDLSGGLTPDHELFFAERPADPEMRESTSIWLFDDAGRFGAPRLGIEAEAWSWDADRSYQANFSLGPDRLHVDVGRGDVPSPIGPDGRATRFGAGPMRFELIEPFRRWRVRFDGDVASGTAQQKIDGTYDMARRVPLRLDVELTMATPGWVQDHTPEKVALMSPTDADDARSMGIGWRIEHLFRARGTLTVDGETIDFTGTGLRIKRQSVRPLAGFRGHVWQSALFPDGRAFGYIAYPPGPDGRTYNDGYIYRDGRFHPARATRMPWLERFLPEGDDVSLELESDLGTTRIAGVTAFSSFDFHNPELAGGRFNLQQTGARYTWDDQTAYGMLERSSVSDG
ncbi:MAG: hypothetical protein KGN34_16955 [Sphingomonadales bacterium]|nr:hypothetical protein [Sphingomonadales bacterium]